MAAGLAAELKESVGIEAELIAGGGGIFLVKADDQVVYDKEQTDRFPLLGEVSTTLLERFPQLAG